MKIGSFPDTPASSLYIAPASCDTRKPLAPFLKNSPPAAPEAPTEAIEGERGREQRSDHFVDTREPSPRRPLKIKGLRDRKEAITKRR
jgi:hypothetical protein